MIIVCLEDQQVIHFYLFRLSFLFFSSRFNRAAILENENRFFARWDAIDLIYWQCGSRQRCSFLHFSLLFPIFLFFLSLLRLRVDIFISAPKRKYHASLHTRSHSFCFFRMHSLFRAIEPIGKLGEQKNKVQLANIRHPRYMPHPQPQKFT